MRFNPKDAPALFKSLGVAPVLFSYGNDGEACLVHAIALSLGIKFKDLIAETSYSEDYIRGLILGYDATYLFNVQKILAFLKPSSVEMAQGVIDGIDSYAELKKCGYISEKREAATGSINRVKVNLVSIGNDHA